MTIQFALLFLGLIYLLVDKFFITKKDESFSDFKKASRLGKLGIIISFIISVGTIISIYSDNKGNELTRNKIDKRRVDDSLRMQQIIDSLISIQKSFKAGLLEQYHIDTAILHTSTKHYTTTLDQYRSVIDSFATNARNFSTFKDRVVNPLKDAELYITINYSFNPFLKDLELEDFKLHKRDFWSTKKIQHWQAICDFITWLLEENNTVTIINSRLGVHSNMYMDFSKSIEQLQEQFKHFSFELTLDDKLMHGSLDWIKTEINSVEGLYSVYDFDGSEIEIDFTPRRFSTGHISRINDKDYIDSSFGSMVWHPSSKSIKSHDKVWHEDVCEWFREYGLKIDSVELGFNSTNRKYILNKVLYSGDRYCFIKGILSRTQD